MTPASAEQGVTNSGPVSENNASAIPTSIGDGLVDFNNYLEEIAVNPSLKSELDQYLEESLTPRIPQFDILNWWKLPNTLKDVPGCLGYPNVHGQ